MRHYMSRDPPDGSRRAGIPIKIATQLDRLKGELEGELEDDGVGAAELGLGVGLIKEGKGCGTGTGLDTAVGADEALGGGRGSPPSDVSLPIGAG